MQTPGTSFSFPPEPDFDNDLKNGNVVKGHLVTLKGKDGKENRCFEIHQQADGRIVQQGCCWLPFCQQPDDYKPKNLNIKKRTILLIHYREPCLKLT